MTVPFAATVARPVSSTERDCPATPVAMLRVPQRNENAYVLGSLPVTVELTTLFSCTVPSFGSKVLITVTRLRSVPETGRMV